MTHPRDMRDVSPYIDRPTIPEGMTVVEYRINRPNPKVPGVRQRLLAALR
jgi:hypothetical protein